MNHLPGRSGKPLFKINVRCHELRSTLMTSNRPMVDWGKRIGDVHAAAFSSLPPSWHFAGQAVDLLYNKIAINLALRNHYGHVVHGNSLTNTTELIYETGRVQVWDNAIRKIGRVPLRERNPEELDFTASPTKENPVAEETEIDSSLREG